MSLKNIILKTGAASIAVSIIFSNCSMFGLGLSKVIAENLKAPEIEANLTSQKYVQYQTEEYSGVALQTELEVNSIQEQEGYLPVSSTNLEVKLPNINGHLPERASVVKASTEATTGEKENTRINQNYDSNSGLLTVSYENIQNSDGNIYTEFKKDAKDKFEIIYIYPAEAYTGNEEEVALQYTVNAKMAFKTENEKITSEKTKSFELKEKENKGDITTFNVTELKENIYKGFMYSNVENKTNYDTAYKTVSTLCVLNSQVLNETTMELKESKFVLNDKEETEATTNGKVVYKSTGIRKAEFDKILGQDGSLEIYNGETLLATVKYIEVVEGNKKTVKKLAIVYSEEDVKVLSDEETSAIVEYKEDVTALTIKTSKPIAEGFMNFENQNTIKAAKDYGVDVKDIKYIRVATNVNTYNSKTDIQLLEPETRISVSSSNTNFSTLQTSKTTLTIKLDDTNASTKLLDNPTITIKLPNGLTGGKLSSPEILNGNGLSIKSAKADNNVITIELEGKQTSYDLNNVSGGVNIVMDIENIDFNDKTPTHKDKIEVDCVQGSNKVTTSCDVNINSKFGLLMISSLTGYNNKETTTTMDSTLKTITVEKEGEEKVLTKNIDIVNNYEEAIENVTILGKLQYSDNNVTSTFASSLKKIVVEGAKVYYTEKEDASYEDESWTEEYSSSAKAYKIVINKIEKQSSKNIKVGLVLPAKIGYNGSEYLKDEVKYTFNSKILTTSSLMGLETEKIEIAGFNIVPETNIKEYNGLEASTLVYAGVELIDENTEIFEGQILKIIVKLKNTTNNKMENIKIQTDIENAVYYELQESLGSVGTATKYADSDESKLQETTSAYSLEPEETIEYIYQIHVKENVENVKNTIKYIEGDELLGEVTLNNKVKNAKLKLELKSEYNEEVISYTQGKYFFFINITNISDEDLEDIKIICNLPDILSFNENDPMILADEKGNYDSLIKEGENYIWTINKLEKGKTNKIPVRCSVNDMDLSLIQLESYVVSKAYVTSNNEEVYNSNILNKTIYQSSTGLKAKVNSNIQENSVIYINDEIIYTIDIYNTGSLNLKQLSVQANLDTILNKGRILINDKEVNYNSENIEITLDELSLNSGKNMQVKIYAKVNENALQSMDKENILSKFSISAELNNLVNLTDNKKIVIDTKDYTNKEIEYEESLEKDDNNEDLLGSEEIIESEIPKVETDPITPETPIDPEQPVGPETPANPETPTNPIITENKYTISGLAWLDSNKDGQRNNDERLMDSVIVSLVNKDTGNFAIDDSGNKITATTNLNGEYKFEYVKEGTYLVLFEFDTNTYTVTTYQKTNVEQSLNSDAIITTITINGEKKLAGITDNITLNSNKENLDIGLIENAAFDLSLNKQITNVTVTNSQGTQEFKYEDGETAKVDLVAKYINTATVIVNYKFTITNNGDTVGYVDSLVDNLPSGLEYSSELNKDWYKGSDGQLYTTSLSGIAIKPGESTEVELILTKNMTENNTGTFVNNAELEKISNLENIQEKEEARENNKSSAILILSIKTGSVMLYTGITVACILILAVGAYIIKKKILDREI